MPARTMSPLVYRHSLAFADCSICQPSAPLSQSTPSTQFDFDIEALLEEAQPRWLRLARLNGIPADAVDDVVQETCLEAWRHLEHLRQPERFAA